MHSLSSMRLHKSVWTFQNRVVNRRVPKRVCRRSGNSVRAVVNKEESSEDDEAFHSLLQSRKLSTSLKPEEMQKEMEQKIETETTDAGHGLDKRSVKYSGLKGNPLSCGVNSATESYELPSPSVAARNLVPFAPIG